VIKVLDFSYRRFLSSLLLSCALATSAYAQELDRVTPMEDNEFWAIVEIAKQKSGKKVEARPDSLLVELSALESKKIEQFQAKYDDLLLNANTWNLWGAAYLMNGGCAEDCFRNFRDWLISEGKSTFSNSVRNPEWLAGVARRESYELEAYGQSAGKAFNGRTGSVIRTNAAVASKDPVGTEWLEDELPKLLPRIALKFRNR
jgi:Protein of unknown function (DUF4240)